MIKKLPYKSRITGFIGFITFLIVLSCWLLYSIYTPKYNQQLGYVNQTRTMVTGNEQTTEANALATRHIIATTTKEMQLKEAVETEKALEYWAQTQTANPTNTATSTQTLTPTFTSTPTLTNTATLTPTFTPPPEVILCQANVANRNDVKAYTFPNLSMVDEIINLSKKQEVSIIGRLQDNPWIKVNIDGAERWMISSDVEVSQTCNPNVFDLSFLLDEAKSTRVVLIDDTFSSNKYGWVNSPLSDFSTIQ